MTCRWIPFLLLLVCSACDVGVSDPLSGPARWEETELSQIAANWQPGGEWSDRGIELGTLEHPMKLLQLQPNLYDLHAPSGALRTLAERHLVPTVRILEAAGFDIDVNTRGVVAFEGRPRRVRLGIGDENGPIVLPRTRARQSVPLELGLISINERGMLRVWDGEKSFPINIPDLSEFVSRWKTDNKVLGPFKRRSKPPVRAQVIRLTSQTFSIDGEELPRSNLQAKIADAIEGSDLPILFLLGELIEFGEAARVLDQIYRSAATRQDLRLAWPSLAHRKEIGDGGLAIPIKDRHLSGPVMAIAAHTAVDYDEVDRVLRIVGEHCHQVVLLTDLDTSDRDGISAKTWPGGLPGGLRVTLSSEVGTVVAADPYEFEDESLEENVLDAVIDDEDSFYDDDESSFESAQPIRVTGNVEAPIELYSPTPEYTETARRARIQGTVILELTIDTEGFVEDAKVLKGLPMGLSESARDTVLDWEFEPAILDGEPVAVYHRVTVEFELEAQPR